MVVCLERGADLHTGQLMPLPLTVSCFSEIQTGFTFLVLAHPSSPGKRAVKRVCVCVCVRVCVCVLVSDKMPVFLWSCWSCTVHLEEDAWVYVVSADALPVTWQRESKQWRKDGALTPTSGSVSYFPHPPPDFWWKWYCSLYASSPMSTCNSKFTSYLW